MTKLLLPLLISHTYAYSINSLLRPISGRGRVAMMNTPDFDPLQPIHKLDDSPDEPDLWTVNDLLNDDASNHLDTLMQNDIFSLIQQIKENDDGQIYEPINAPSFEMIRESSEYPGGGDGGGGGGSDPMRVGKLESSVIQSEDIDTSFEDVAGCDESKYELEEIVDFLKNPERYRAAGAKVPKGVLLEGPPGTGKTLLARAVAGEANVSFIQVSASEFVQMYVGLGASRVRDLFKLAKENSPCVIFIDEIDAVGKKRGSSGNNGNDEREQTLNQILTSMDGFEQSDSIIVLAATNRADTLDSALTRSGRFDRKVGVGMPDVSGRRKILDVHLKGKTVEPNTDLDEIAILTSGFSGADIENMANEAVILALRENKTAINSKNLIDAYEKITIGLPMTSKDTNEFSDELVSYHESGHAITALLFRDFFDVRKVTITANTNGAGGYTLLTPKEQYNSYPTKKYILADLIITMGGRAAEMILFNVIKKDELDKNKLSNYTNAKLFDGIKDLDVTTGASSDLKHADSLARKYIELFGYDDELSGYSKTIQYPNNPLTSLSEDVKSEIDNHVIKLINFGLEKAIEIIESNLDTFNKLATDLIEKRSVDIKYLDTLEVTHF
jgi:cell division protease FtsH